MLLVPLFIEREYLSDVHSPPPLPVNQLRQLLTQSQTCASLYVLSSKVRPSYMNNYPIHEH